jgi:hypothetical protein
MEGRRTVDFHEGELLRLERLKSQIVAAQMAHLAELDRMQVATRDGSRNLSEWVSARSDTSIGTARSLVRTMRRTADRPKLREGLASGEISFDRVEALSRISEDVGFLPHLDVSGIYREAAKRTSISAESEVRTAEGQFLVMQPSLDESWWKLWGGLDGYAGTIVDKVLSEAATSFPTCLMGVEVTGPGGKPLLWSVSVSEKNRRRRRSPCSSTLTKPPKPTVRPE